MIKDYTIGSDAEVILNDLSGRPFPACGLLGGTKAKPRQLGNTPYTIQEDNVLLEFNIPVCKSLDEFTHHMRNGLSRALQELPPSLVASSASTAVFDRLVINFPQAHVFGCDPDFNAWTMEENPKPFCENKELRSAAGHIHIGWDKPTNEERIALIKAADIFAGLRSVLYGMDRERRKLYGKAGSFRPKSYGIEHRVLDNEWVIANQSKEVYFWYADAINFTNAGFVSKLTSEDEVNIQKAINEYDVELSNKLLSKFKAELKKLGLMTADEALGSRKKAIRYSDYIYQAMNLTGTTTQTTLTGNNG